MNLTGYCTGSGAPTWETPPLERLIMRNPERSCRIARTTPLRANTR